VKRNAVAFLSGVIFAVGLALSGMLRPSKVLGFLDVAGAWDASLAFVMLGAVALNLVAFRLILRRGRPWFDRTFHVPASQRIDGRLVLGAALFGVGWGLAGYCPGPGLVAIVGGHVGPIVFVAAMVAGFLLQHLADGMLGTARR
jgi:uncharacterized membrane protein YedE/YeeE